MLDKDCSIVWGAYWGEAQSVIFAPLLILKVVFKEVNFSIIITAPVLSLTPTSSTKKATG